MAALVIVSKLRLTNVLSDVMECGQRYFLPNVFGFEGLKWSDSTQIV